MSDEKESVVKESEEEAYAEGLRKWLENAPPNPMEKELEAVRAHLYDVQGQLGNMRELVKLIASKIPDK